MPKPKIIVCATAYHPYIGGAEIAVAEVAKRLSGRFDFIVLASRMSRRLPRRENRSEGTLIRLGFGARFDKWLLPLFIFWHFVSNFEFRAPGLILWGMDISQGSLAAAAIKWFFPRTPFILTVQYGESEARLRAARGGAIRRAFGSMLGQADIVTAISGWLLDLSRDFGYCGPAALIHNGVDVEKFKRQNAKGKSTWHNQKIIITASRLVPKNGVDVLIRAFAEAKKQIPDLRLHIVGEGAERKKLENLASLLGVQDTITFFGAVPHERIPRYLEEADLFVRPSRSEGMGNAFVEALAAGLPIIGTPVGGIPDIIEDGKTGLLASPEDIYGLAKTIDRALSEEGLAERLVRNGKEKVAREFSWDAIAGRYGAVFRQALDAKKRAIVATGLFPPEIGGPATYSKLLTGALPRRGVLPRVVPFRAVRHLPKLVRHVSYFCKVASASRGSDVIFAQDPVSVGLPAFLAAWILRKKFILKIVGDYAWEQMQVKSEKRKMKNGNVKLKTIEEFQRERYDLFTEMRRAAERFVARRAERVIVPSEYLKGIVTRWGVLPEKTAVIYNAFAPPRILESKDKARRRLGIPPDSFAIISVGRLVPWKGFDALIAAMPHIRREMPSARLYIIGSGPEKQALEASIRAAGLGEAAALTGAIAHVEVLNHLRAGDLFILNSSYEGFSHTLLEAMAMEIPVMASAVGGNEELITDGVHGVLYNSGSPEKIAHLVTMLAGDVPLRQRLAAAAKKSLARFGTAAMIDKTVALLVAG